MTDYYQSLSIIRKSLMEDKQSTDKEKIKIFLDQFKKLSPLDKYQNDSQRHSHFDYIEHLLSIKKDIQKEDYQAVMNSITFLLLEEGEYLLQKRYYVNLIHILENIE